MTLADKEISAHNLLKEELSLPKKASVGLTGFGRMLCLHFANIIDGSVSIANLWHQQHLDAHF